MTTLLLQVQSHHILGEVHTFSRNWVKLGSSARSPHSYATCNPIRSSQNVNTTPEDLRDGLQNMDTLTGIAEQISRCLDYARSTTGPGSLIVILKHLEDTIEVLAISRRLRNLELARDRGTGMLMLLLADGPPADANWRDWFRATQRYICLRLVNETNRANDNNLRRLIASLQTMLHDTRTKLRHHPST